MWETVSLTVLAGAWTTKQALNLCHMSYLSIQKHNRSIKRTYCCAHKFTYTDGVYDLFFLFFFAIFTRMILIKVYTQQKAWMALKGDAPHESVCCSRCVCIKGPNIFYPVLRWLFLFLNWVSKSIVKVPVRSLKCIKQERDITIFPRM